MRFCFLSLMALLAIAFVWSSSPQIASASIHRYPEAADRVMWRSLQTLRDEHDAAWQVVFYKRLDSGEVDRLNLRLVAFPGGTELRSSEPLTVSTRNGQSWAAAPAASVPLPSTAAEYDVRLVMRELQGNPAIELGLPLAGQRLRLIVPPFVVQEWQTVAQKSS